jgi:hypothetical protein
MNKIGEIMMGMGVVYLFRQNHSGGSCMESTNNTWEIILTSIFLIFLGSIMSFSEEKRKYN